MTSKQTILSFVNSLIGVQVKVMQHLVLVRMLFLPVKGSRFLINFSALRRCFFIAPLCDQTGDLFVQICLMISEGPTSGEDVTASGLMYHRLTSRGLLLEYNISLLIEVAQPGGRCES